MPQSTTPTLGLQYIYSNQSQKEVLINNNFKKIDDFLGTSHSIDSQTIPANNDKIIIVVSDTGNILSGSGTNYVNVTRISTGKYRINASDGSVFERSKRLIFTAYVYNEQYIPYFSNIVFSSNNRIDIFIFYLLNGTPTPMDAAFTLVCN